MTPIIEARNLCVCRQRADILKEVSFSLERGEFLAVLGPNGAGKSTLLQSIPGLIQYDGQLKVLGSDVRRLSPRARGRLRRRIGYVPQLHSRPVAVLPLSVREVVELGRVGVRGMGRRFRESDRQICDRIMEETQLGALGDRSVVVLSGGEQRKAHLARALAQEPEVLLLDEPAGHLDFRWQEAITLLVGHLWRTTQMTVIMVTHDLRHLPAGITRVALLKAGRLIRIGSPADILQDQPLSDLYDLPLRVVKSGGRYLAVPEESE